MARKSETSALIGGYKYKVTKFGARIGTDMSIRVARLLGPAIMARVQVGDADPLKLAGAVLSAFSGSATTDDLHAFCDALATHTRVVIPLKREEGGKTVANAEHDLTDWDAHFADNASLEDLAQWVLHGVKVNFADFFAGVGISLGSPKPEATPPNTSDPNQSTTP